MKYQVWQKIQYMKFRDMKLSRVFTSMEIWVFIIKKNLVACQSLSLSPDKIFCSVPFLWIVISTHSWETMVLSNHGIREKSSNSIKSYYLPCSSGKVDMHSWLIKSQNTGKNSTCKKKVVFPLFLKILMEFKMKG